MLVAYQLICMLAWSILLACIASGNIWLIGIPELITFHRLLAEGFCSLPTPNQCWVTPPSGGVHKLKQYKTCCLSPSVSFGPFLLSRVLTCISLVSYPVLQNSRVCRYWPVHPAQTGSTHPFLSTSLRKKWIVAWLMTTSYSGRSLMYDQYHSQHTSNSNTCRVHFALKVQQD